MLMNRFEDLWNSGDDGASARLGPIDLPSKAELDGLLNAWFVERRNSIEFELLLDESRKLIRRMLDEADLSPSTLRIARRLIRVIESTLRTAETGNS